MVLSDKSGEFRLYAANTQEEVKLAMQDLWLTGTVLPTGARLIVRHVFQSQEDVPLEVIYSFALPRDSAMRGFRIVGEGFEAHSELRSIEEAEQLYERAIDSGHLSAMTKTYGDGIVNLNVGNIRPGETVTVLLEIVSGVELHDDGFRFRFPFTIAPGYHSKAVACETEPDTGELSLPEDEFGDLILPQWKRDAKGLHRVGFDLSVDLPTGLLSVSSPSHPVSMRQDEKTRTRVQLAVASDIPDRDLVLDVRYKQREPLVLAGVDSDGKGRFCAVIPSSCFGKTPNVPRRVVFLIDRSGSMDGEPIHQALRSVKACLGALSERDLFGIVAFDDAQEVFDENLVTATMENRDGAARFIAHIDARGGTELAAGVKKAVRVLGEAGGEVLLLTDGQVLGGEGIIARVQVAGVRLHCLGIGSASQDRFLALIARSTGGTSRFVTSRERVDMAVLEVFSAIGSVVATDVDCRIDKMSRVSIEPEIRREVLDNSPWVVTGSCKVSSGGILRLRWNAEEDQGEMELPIAIQAGLLGETLKLVQGARLITDTESNTVPGTKSRAVSKRKVSRVQHRLAELSREYHLTSRAMALVAVVNRRGDSRGRLPKTEVIPVGLPQDAQMESYYGPYPSPSSCARQSSVLRQVCGDPYYESVREESSGFLYRIPGHESGQDVFDSLPFFSTSDREEGEDLLLSLACSIQSDGGMPGRDVKERIAASLLVLLVFDEMGHTTTHGAFSAHVRRLMHFMAQCDASELPEDRAAALRLCMKQLGKSRLVSGPWEDLAHGLSYHEESWSTDRFWDALRNTITEMRA